MSMSNNPAGRPRSENIDRRILEETLRLAREDGYARVTMEAIARAAGVGKPSLYRRWPAKAHILFEALQMFGREALRFDDTGDLGADLTAGLVQVARLLAGPDGRLVSCLFAEAQFDETLKPELSAFLHARREGARARLVAAGIANPDALLDRLYGPIIYRLLSGLDDLTDDFVADLVTHALRGL